MLKEFKFVMGSVAKKDLLPALTHFRIEGGTVRGFNGTVALCTPVPLDLDCAPKAEQLVKALANCNETVQFSMTTAGRLKVSSGAFKMFVDCVAGETPHAMPEGDVVEGFDGISFLQALDTLWPFVGDDASRPWSNGILLDGPSAFATTNVVAAEFWVGAEFPHRINVPRAAIKEILRIKEPPIGAQCNATSLTLHYSDGRWLRTQLLETQWPDIRQLLDKVSNQQPIDPRLFAGLKVVKPFVDKMNRVIFSENGIRTHHEDGEGASYDIEAFNTEGVYSLEMLALLDGVAKTIDFQDFPEPALWMGDRIRGAIIGIRL